MNLADWLQKDHSPAERMRMAASVCRAVGDNGGRPLALDPSRIPVSGGESQPEDGKGAPSGRYRAPETAEGQTASAQAQVYTVGVLCFEILSGRSFEARGGPLLRDVRSDLPRDLCDAVQACLEMDAEWRPKDVTYLQGLLEAQASTGSSSKPAASRAADRATPAPRTGRRTEPAPRPWPLLVFALVALAGSIGFAVFRLRQPIEGPSLPPAPPSVAPVTSPPAEAPVASAKPALPSPPAETRRTTGTVTPAPAPPTPAPPTTASPTPPVAKASVRPTPPVATVPSPVVVATAPSPVVVATPPPAPPSTEAPAQPAVPAAVTQVSPPLLRRGITTLVDVHGVGMRSEHQARFARAKGEAAHGIEVVRQRFVNATLLQVLLKIDATAPPGAYTLFLVDAQGNATNARPFELAK
jgi:hypothetical protein